MKTPENALRIALPRDWSIGVKSAMLHVIAMAQFALAYTRGWAANSPIARVRLKTENDRLRQQVALLAEQIRIKDTRMLRIPAQERPHYLPTERMSILELRAARSWNTQQTADAFLVTPATISSWMKRLDEDGDSAIVQIREPVNKFPDFVRYAVQRLKTLCPAMGKVKMAQTLCRAGLHIGVTTVGRILKESPRPLPEVAVPTSDQVVTAKHPNHVWHIDLTTVPVGGGFWAPWLPFSLPQCWPFCWWLAVIVDHYSRRAMGIAIFNDHPTAQAICVFVERAISEFGASPKYIICDKGKIFWCDKFKHWCKERSIRPRFGAIGKHGSIAVVERFIRTLKDECTRRIVVPLRHGEMRNELNRYVAWYNGHRPHTTLEGATPNEVYSCLRPAKQQPRIEPRKQWPRNSPCARPNTLIAGQPGDRFDLDIQFLDAQRHLPVVSLRRAA